jgi:LEA14-like dessication related protein
MRSALRTALFTAALALLAACAMLPGGEPLQVNVADVESLEGQGMEWRMLVKLRVQNPNDAPVEYDGVYLKLEVLDQTFATGVSDERGTIPRFGEAVVSVPVTVSTVNIVRHVIGMAVDGKPPEKISYRLEGKLSSPGFGSTRFDSHGEIALPGAVQ